MDLDIYDIEQKYLNSKRLIAGSTISERNKELLQDFAEDCLLGWKVNKLSKTRIISLLSRIFTQTNETIKKDWDMFEERDAKKVLIWLETRYPIPNGEWSQHSHKIALRKFVTWIRHKHGYPPNYPDRERLQIALSTAKFAPEVTHIHVKEPNRLKDAKLIPTEVEMAALRNIASHPRDRAYIEMSIENGERVGALLSRQIKHVIAFDDLGARVILHDKTFRGEPVRYITSATHLRHWMDVHPFRDNPEAPLWIDLTKLPDCQPLSYYALRRMLIRLIRRHNKGAAISGKPLIRETMTTHLFRYFAQVRDVKSGMPRSILTRQRGWSSTSRQPEKYARLTTDDIDDYFRGAYNLKSVDKPETPKETIIRCPRCQEINQLSSKICNRCGMSLRVDVALQMEKDNEEFEHVMAVLLEDPDFKKLIWKKKQKIEAEQKKQAKQ
jgi:integrase/recombinase XerD